MSRRNHTPYYEDEGLMAIVDYSTPRRGEDLTSPNAPRQVNTNQPRDTVIVPATPAHTTTRVIDDEFFITKRFEGIELNSGELIDVLDLSGEAGEIVSIEVVTDNPYTGVYLEMDDYKNSRGAQGVTAAELIMRNKTEPAEREFYATDMREDGKFVIRYSPSEGDSYTDKIKLQVRNDIGGTYSVFNRVVNNRLTMRQGLPVPRLLSHSAGWYIRHQDFASADVSGAGKLLRGLGPYRYECPVRNLASIDDPNIRVGPYNPYMNTAAEIELTPSTFGAANVTIVWGEPGQAVTDTTGIVAPNPVAWPGEFVGDTYTPSEQQIIIYGNRTENESTVIPNAVDIVEICRLAEPMFIKNGNTIYFPGEVVMTQFFDPTAARYKEDKTQEGDQSDLPASRPYDPAGANDGAVVVTLSPGLPFKPRKVVLDANRDDFSANNAFSNISFEENFTPKTASGRIRIQEIVVTRKRKKTLLL